MTYRLVFDRSTGKPGCEVLQEQYRCYGGAALGAFLDELIEFDEIRDPVIVTAELTDFVEIGLVDNLDHFKHVISKFGVPLLVAA